MADFIFMFVLCASTAFIILTVGKPSWDTFDRMNNGHHQTDANCSTPIPLLFSILLLFGWVFVFIYHWYMTPVVLVVAAYHSDKCKLPNKTNAWLKGKIRGWLDAE